MPYLIIISGTSFLGASFIIFRRVHKIREDGIKGIYGRDAYWPFDVIWDIVKKATMGVFRMIYDFIAPYIKKGISFVAKKLYEVTGKFSRYFLKVYKMVEGKRETKSNPEDSSEFLKNISGYKDRINK